MHWEGQTLAHSPQATHFSLPSFPICNSGSPRNLDASFGRSSGYCIVTHVFGLRNLLIVSTRPLINGTIILSFKNHDKSREQYIEQGKRQQEFPAKINELNVLGPCVSLYFLYKEKKKSR